MGENCIIRMHWQAVCSHMYSSCGGLNMNTNLELCCNGTERDNSESLEKIFPLSWNALVSNQVIRGERPATNNMNHDRVWFILETHNN